MNSNNKVRLIDFISCLNSSAYVLVELIRDGKIYLDLFEDQVTLFEGSLADSDKYFVLNVRFSVLESRYVIKVKEVQV